MSPSTETRENREFARELKVLITRPLAEQIREWARARLSPDPNAAGSQHDTYRISSLYFDTERFDVFQRNGSYGRSKYRIRRYGEAERVFLERKLKTQGLVSKRRTLVPVAELDRLRADGEDGGWAGRWYRRRLLARKLAPVCQIAYERTARVLMTPLGAIRLTLDENIRALALTDLQFQNSATGALLTPGQVILELKFRGELPALFRQLTQEFGLAPQPVSKYRRAIAELRLMAEPTEESASDAAPSPILCLAS